MGNKCTHELAPFFELIYGCFASLASHSKSDPPPSQLLPTIKFDAIVLAQYKHQIKVAHINELISYPKYYNGNWITLISTSPVAVMCNEFIWLFGWTAIIFMEISSWLSRVRKTYTHTHPDPRNMHTYWMETIKRGGLSVCAKMQTNMYKLYFVETTMISNAKWSNVRSNIGSVKI